MRRGLAALSVICAVGLWPLSGSGAPTITVYDIASSDVPGPQPIRAFPVPAAAGWSGAQLVYDNYAEGLGFSPVGASDISEMNLLTMPLSNAHVTINNVSYDSGPSNLQVDNTVTTIFTNEEGSDADPLADNRFPYHIPRPQRWCGEWFSSFQFDLASATPKFGVFLAGATNWPWLPDRHNFLNMAGWSDTDPLSGMPMDVYVQGVGESFAEAYHERIVLPFDGEDNMSYCPFVMVEDAEEPIQAVTIIHDCYAQGKLTYGFMDVYVGVGLPPPGDATGDGCVDGADYTAWADHYLWTGVPAYSAGGWTVGNWTEDDTVDGADYTCWADNYLKGCPPQVPEPATLSVLGLCGCLALLRRKR